MERDVIVLQEIFTFEQHGEEGGRVLGRIKPTSIWPKFMTKLEDQPDRLHFPWKTVDGMAVLLPGSVLTIYASQTGCGKSLFANQIALYNAREYGETILNMQVELSYEEMYNIIAAHVLGKDRNHLEEGDGAKAAERLKGVKYYIGRDPNITTLNAALDLIEKAIKHLGVTVAILDHFHHFTCGDGDNEVKQQAAAMQRIKRISQETGTKFIVISQPRKSDQQHERKKGVNISSIKGSEALSSAADAVFGMHRDMLTEFNPSNPPRDLKDPKTEIHALKARAQGLGGSYAELMLDGKTATFFETERREEAPPPATMFE
jgi:replicative DNA helicase